MNMQAKIGNSMLKTLLQLREQKGELSIQDVGAMLEQMATSLRPDETELDKFLRAEIEKLAAHISAAKREILELTPDAESKNGIGDASLHLDAVIKSTEEASNIIMDAADEIQAQAAGVGGEKEQKILDATHRIYEACNFQDLTGQRITKVITLLNYIDEKISKLDDLFHAGNEAAEKAAVAASGDSKVIQGNFMDSELLNGPQLPGSAPTQADIDALFNDIKPN